MKDFRELKVWQKAHRLALDTYQVTRSFPKEELYGLTSQLRRACTSIPTNIAEGCGRGSDADLCRFVQIAMGSASETEYHFLLAHDLGHLAPNDYQELFQKIVEIKRMLTGLIQSLKV